MNIIAVDDEHYSLIALEKVLKNALPDASLSCYSNPHDAYADAINRRVDVAFLDIEMPEISGLKLAKKLKDIYRDTNIIFVTGYNQYAVDAFSLQASGYLMKPVTVDAVLKNMEWLRRPFVMATNKRIHIQTFGNFEVFVDGKPLQITRPKPKELLAYLVDKRGTPVTPAQIAAVLWENKFYDRALQKNTQTTISRLIQILDHAGIKEIIVKSYNNIAVDTTKFDCDYYRLLNHEAAAANAYMGEYMTEYSWAEMTAGALADKLG